MNHNVYTQSTQNSSKKNVFSQLAELPEEVANAIIHAKSNGGRALNAIFKNTTLSTSEKFVLTYLGSRLNFTTEKFDDQYQYTSLTEIMGATSLSRRGTINILKKLEELEYIRKKRVSYEKQQIGYANEYCLTFKVFDDYISSLIAEYEFKGRIKGVKSTKSVYQKAETKKQMLVNSVHQGSELSAPYNSPSIPSYNSPNVCVVQEQPTHTNLRIEESKTENPKAAPLALKEKEGAITGAMAANLGEYLKSLTGMRWFGNDEARLLIARILKSTGLNVKQYQEEFFEFKQFRGLHTVFNRTEASVPTLEAALINWCQNKGQIIDDYKYPEKKQARLKKEMEERLSKKQAPNWWD